DRSGGIPGLGLTPSEFEEGLVLQIIRKVGAEKFAVDGAGFGILLILKKGLRLQEMDLGAFFGVGGLFKETPGFFQELWIIELIHADEALETRVLGGSGIGVLDQKTIIDGPGGAGVSGLAIGIGREQKHFGGGF